MFLSVSLTNKCTAACGHCCVSSGPNRSEAAEYEATAAAIESLSKTRPLNAVQFVGGEPTLAKRNLLKLLPFIKSKGIETQIITNASFAINGAKAARVIGDLRSAGLDHFHMSYDDHHAPFVPFERVATAWRVAKDFRFRSVVVLVAHGPKSVIDPAWIRTQLGEDIPDFDRSACASRPRDTTNYGISSTPLQRIGRGATEVRPEEARVRRDGRNVFQLRCLSIFMDRH